jgi:hypothetical protein
MEGSESPINPNPDPTVINKGLVSIFNRFIPEMPFSKYLQAKIFSGGNGSQSDFSQGHEQSGSHFQVSFKVRFSSKAKPRPQAAFLSKAARSHAILSFLSK